MDRVGDAAVHPRQFSSTVFRAGVRPQLPRTHTRRLLQDSYPSPQRGQSRALPRAVLRVCGQTARCSISASSQPVWTAACLIAVIVCRSLSL
jgi:hypothetical protein